MALIGAGVQVIPLLGAAVFLPSTMATALRLHVSSDARVGGNDKDPLDEFLAGFLSPEDQRRLAIEINLQRELGEEGILSRTYQSHDFIGDDNEDNESEYKRTDFERTRKHGLSFETGGSTEAPSQRPVGSLDTWSVVWYCGMFAAFTSLFLIMPCSQVLCKAGLAAARRDPRLRPRPPLLAPSGGMHYGTPPPPYKQFAPPPYESLFLGPNGSASHQPLEKKGVYIIPLREEVPAASQSSIDLDAPPPPYETATDNGNSAFVTAAVVAAVTTASTPSGMSPSVA